MEGLISKQAAFIDIIGTNGTSYTQDDLHQVHSHLPIDAADFDEMLLLLDTALREQRVEPEPGAAIRQVFASYREAIVKRSGTNRSFRSRRPESPMGPGE